eukprot:6174784-Pleurochrysis_carterae.AAC.1
MGRARALKSGSHPPPFPFALARLSTRLASSGRASRLPKTSDEKRGGVACFERRPPSRREWKQDTRQRTREAGGRFARAKPVMSREVQSE